MWKELCIDRKTSPPEPAVITPSPSLTVEFPDGYRVEPTRIIGIQDIKFYASVFEGSDSNHESLDPRIAPLCDGLIMRLFHESSQIGFVAAIAHNIRILGSPSCLADEPSESPRGDSAYIEVRSSLTTHLSIKPAYQSRGLAGLLIKALMSQGHGDGVISGYFYGFKPKTMSAIPIRSWYRIINVRECHRAGYGILIPKIEGLGPTKEHHLEFAKRFYAIKPATGFTVRDTLWSDFEHLTRRRVMISLTEDDFERLKLGPVKWTTIVGPSNLMICGVRPSKICKPNGITIPTGLLVYCETNGEITDVLEFKKYFEMLLAMCRDAGFWALHGVAIGCLSFGTVDFLGPLLAIDAGLMFLDFYNLCTGRTRIPRDVSLLYV